MRLLAAFSMAVVCVLSSPGAAGARAATQPHGDVSKELVLEIVTAPDPESLMADLTAEERATVLTIIEENLVPSDDLGVTAALSPVEAASAGLKFPKAKEGGPSSSVAMSSGCWTHYYYSGWTLWRMKTAEPWMQLNWCASNGRITGSNFSSVGGAALIISYDGNTRGTRDVGWEVRGLTTHKFSFHLGSVTKCMQIRGGATGLYSRGTNCSLG